LRGCRCGGLATQMSHKAARDVIVGWPRKETVENALVARRGGRWQVGLGFREGGIYAVIGP